VTAATAAASLHERVRHMVCSFMIGFSVSIIFTALEDTGSDLSKKQETIERIFKT
jgi:hypothetical protein